MIKVGFVILHYMSIEMTECCVNLLLNLFEHVEIVIVDNASSNGTGVILRKKYEQSENVTVILNEDNLGFAKGNNVGYCYLKKKMVDFIIIMNNDIVIADSEFINKVIDIYKKSNAGVIGPNIISLSNQKAQSPLRLKRFSDEELKKLYLHHVRKVRLNWLYYVKSLLKDTFKSDECVDIDSSKVYINPVLHGACLIFTPDFIRVNEHAFDECTFLYFEEDILYEKCRKKGINLLYNPSIKVYHLEDISTNISIKGKREKLKFKAKCEMESLLGLMEIRDYEECK